MSIYVLRYGDLIKIGYSSDLAKRVTAIMAAIPGEVSFVGHMPGGQEVEAHLHSTFSATRFSGEWFKSTPEMEAFCRTILIPEMLAAAERVTGTRKAQSVETNQAAKATMRAYALRRWPEATHRARIGLLAEDLGWLKSRVFDFYHGSKTAVLRAAEAEQVAALAPELAGTDE